MQILNFQSSERRGNTAPADLTPDTEFDHQPLNYINLEFQKRRTKTKTFSEIHHGGVGNDPSTLGVGTF